MSKVEVWVHMTFNPFNAPVKISEESYDRIKQLLEGNSEDQDMACQILLDVATDYTGYNGIFDKVEPDEIEEFYIRE